MELRQIMRTGVVTIDATETASAASSTMKRKRIRHLVVTGNAGIAGILSERDLSGKDNSNRIVRDLMQPDPISLGPEATLTEVADLSSRRSIVRCGT